MDFTGFQNNLIELVNLSKSRGRSRFRNAIYHLEKAWAIRQIDAEMAIFRAITAEEEAASGLIHLLQELKYPGAHDLNPKSHPHKAAIIPFIAAIAPFFKEVLEGQNLKPMFRINREEGQPLLTFLLIKNIQGEDIAIRPIPWS